MIVKKVWVFPNWQLIVFFLILSFVSPSPQKLNITQTIQTATGKALTIAKNCQELTNRERCYANEFEALTKQTNIIFARKVLSALQNIDNQARGCHLIGHLISRAETRKNPSDWQNLLKRQEPNECSGGFLHGVLEERFSDPINLALDPKQIQEICNIVAQKERAMGQCVHILGHLLLVQTAGDINMALATCDRLPANIVPWHCYSGLFMENFTRLNLVAHGIAKPLAWDYSAANEAEKLCYQQIGAAAWGCWRELTHVYVHISKNNPKMVFDLCQRAPYISFKVECYFHGAGIMAVTSHSNPDNLTKICAMFLPSDSLFEKCNYAIISSMVNSSSKFLGQAIWLCGNLPQKSKESCFREIGKTLRVLPPRGENPYIREPQFNQSVNSILKIKLR